jgi:hypothetical protein
VRAELKPDALRQKASRYRRLGMAINDEKALVILEEMARELETRATRLDRRAEARVSRAIRRVRR